MRRNLFKGLGLFLPMVIFVLAWGTSAAHAKWLILSGSGDALLIQLSVSLPLEEMLVEELSIQIHCKAGQGTVHAQLNSAHTALIGEAVVTYTECQDKVWHEVCAVHGIGEPTGKITTEGTGTASMDGAGNVYVTASSTEFKDVEYLGEECPLTEVNGRTSGTVKIKIGSPLTHSTTHELELVEQQLFFGEDTLVIHDGLGGNPTGTVTSPQAVSFHLVNL